MDWNEIAGKKGKRYAIANVAGVQFTVDRDTDKLHLSISTPRCLDGSQAKRLAEFLRADAVALDVKARHWIADDNAAPVKSHPIPLASRGADEPIDLASDVGRMLGMGGGGK